MPKRSSLNFPSALLVFLLTFGKRCDAQGNTEGVNRLPDGPRGDSSAFFALQSCHQLLNSDSGEFFSPDYLCSNPPLWCNWTIQVDPGKRIHLRLEDFTPDEACPLKQDQIHVDEPGAQSGGHKVLQKCWQEAKYTSSSNTLYVVLLIGGWPDPPYRGFYGHYQAFGPPVVYNPHEGSTGRSQESERSPGLSEPVANDVELENDDLAYDYYDQQLAMAGLPWVPLGGDRGAEAVKTFYPPLRNYSHVFQPTAAPTSTHRMFRSGRGATRSLSGQADSSGRSVILPPQQHDELKPGNDTPTARKGKTVEAASAEESSLNGQVSPDGLEKVEGDRLRVNQASDQQPSSPSDGTETQNMDHKHNHTKVVEPQSEHKGNSDMKNKSESPHLPGDHLFEVAVEVNFSHDLEDSWDSLAQLLLLSVKTLISKQLEALHTRLSLSSKRIKRLNAGALYILWLQLGHGPGGMQIHRAVHSAMQGLLATGANLRVNHRSAVIMSVSTADVNECGTQLVLCDANADCENHFGTYACRCRAGFRDESRLGSGGTTCMEAQPAGCGSGLSSEAKGVYILFFLLSSLILTLLAVAGTLYRRHHYGGFVVRCPSSLSPPDPNNNHLQPDDSYSTPTDCDLPPPPPPARGGRESWAPGKERCPPVDLRLLRFSSLLPADGYIDPQESGKL
ncbi:uncharacterized protein LOC103469901 isoform X1 [Poecilia reticulata]|uniref:Uncharacterized LOC103469901 n=1 Tax=Poecilia reticulata TaxID=8081 RepID=A0A3P9Q812_POERE|nr:PREDICTED: uncharacterized protein LOC103469901 isoform X1 [Poecilia reticulata]